MERAGIVHRGAGLGRVPSGHRARGGVPRGAQPTPSCGSTWLGEAIVALAIGGSAMVRKAFTL